MKEGSWEWVIASRRGGPTNAGICGRLCRRCGGSVAAAALRRRQLSKDTVPIGLIAANVYAAKRRPLVRPFRQRILVLICGHATLFPNRVFPHSCWLITARQGETFRSGSSRGDMCELICCLFFRRYAIPAPYHSPETP